MSTRSVYQGNKRRLLIAFNVGTDFSSASYSILEPGKAPEIRTVNRWPGQEAGANRVPTVVYYDKIGRVLAVGAEEPELDEYNDGDGFDDEWSEPYKVERFIALLHRVGSPNIDAEVALPTLPPQKNIMLVYADFYLYMFLRTRRHIEETHASGILLWNSLNSDIDFVLTYSNEWGETQKSVIRDAVVRAGLVQNTPRGLDRITLVSSAEAQIYFLKSSSEEMDGIIEIGTQFMIIDAGNDSVECDTYSIRDVPPIDLERISTKSISLGSSSVLRHLRTLLEGRLAGSKFGDKSYIDFMIAEFQGTVFKRFKGSGDSYVQFSYLASDKDTRLGIRNGQIKLTSEDIRDCFDPVVRQILSSIENQKRLAVGNLPVYILTGSFASNEYLHGRVKLCVEGVSNQKLYRLNASTDRAVPKGAIEFFIDHHIMTRTAELSYGFRCTRVYDYRDPDHAQRAGQNVVSREGLQLLENGFHPILLKGSKVREDVEFKYPTYFASRRGINGKIQCDIVGYRGNLSPLWIDDDPGNFITLCRITVDASRIPRVVHHNAFFDYYHQNYTVVITFGLKELKAHLTWVEKDSQCRSADCIINNNNSAVTVTQQDIAWKQVYVKKGKRKCTNSESACTNVDETL